MRRTRTAHAPAAVPRRARRAGRARALLAGGAALLRARARTDAPLLAAYAALVALAAAIAVGVPRTVTATLDAGAADAVAGAGPAAVVDTTAPVRGTGGGRVVALEDFLERAATAPDALPPALAAVYPAATTAVVTPPVSLVDDDPVDRRVRTAWMGPQAAAGLRVLAGRMPGDGPGADGTTADPLEVVLSPAAATTLGADLGTHLTIAAPGGPATVGGATEERRGVVVEVVGLVERLDAADPGWDTAPEAWTPVERPGSSDRAPVAITAVLTGAEQLARLTDATAQPAVGTLRLRPEPSALTADDVGPVTADLDALVTGATSVLPGGVTRTGVLPVMRAFPGQAQAATAQMTVAVSGASALAGVVLVLVSRLVVARRRAALELERSRGATVAGIAARLAAESVPLAVVAAALGAGAATLAVPGALGDPWPLVAVVVVGALAAPAQGAWVARGAWTGHRDAANRRDRVLLERRRRARRVVVELAVVALAAAAAAALRTRGLATQAGGTDPFLLLAPPLVALAATVVVLRLHPGPVRLLGVLARRTRGPLGPIGALRAQRGLAALPLLALVLGVALAVSGGLLVETVRRGQDVASWERVGADVRVLAPLTADDVTALAAEPGVTGVGGLHTSGRVSLDYGAGSTIATVVGVDPGAADVLAAAGAAAGPAPDTSALRALADAGAPDGVLPVVGTPDVVLAPAMGVYHGADYLRARGAGTVRLDLSGYLEPPFAFADLDALSGLLSEPLPREMVLVSGPGAEAAVAAVGVPPEAVLTRTGWLADQRDLALHDGVRRTLAVAVVAAALLCAVGLAATVLAGARERGRDLSVLRTLGLPARAGWWLSLAELGPAVVGAVVGGTVAGGLVTGVLAPALGLDVLAGGLSVPAPALDPAVPAAVGAGAVGLLLLTVAVEVAAHRRDRLSEVLRVGGTV